MGWILESLANVFLELLNDLMGWVLNLVGGLQLDIGYDASTVTANGPGKLFERVSPYGITNANSKGLLDTLFPGAGLYMPVFCVLGLTIVFLLLGVKLYKSMLSPLAKEAEGPETLIPRTILSVIGVVCSYSIFVTIERIFNVIYLQFKKIYDTQTADVNSKNQGFRMFGTDLIGDFKSVHNAGLAADAAGQTANKSGEIGELATTIILLIVGTAILVAFFGLVLEIFQRYVVVGILFYTCPLAFAMLCSEETRTVFKSWLRMMFSQFVLMASNLFFVGTFIQAIHIKMGSQTKGIIFETPTDFIVTMFILLGWLIVAQKFDEYLRNTGLSVATTGSGLWGAMAGAVGTIITTTRLAGTAVKAAKGVGSAAVGGVSAAKNAFESVEDKARTAEGAKNLFNGVGKATITEPSAMNGLIRNGLGQNPDKVNLGGTSTLSDVLDKAGCVNVGDHEMEIKDYNGNTISSIYDSNHYSPSGEYVNVGNDSWMEYTPELKANAAESFASQLAERNTDPNSSFYERIPEVQYESGNPYAVATLLDRDGKNAQTYIAYPESINGQVEIKTQAVKPGSSPVETYENLRP